MRAAEIIDAAVQQTGLTAYADLGDPTAREGLERFVEACNEEARLNDLGELGVAGALVAAIGNRLRVLEHLDRNPDVRHEAVQAPVVVVGMFRAGTTLLSNLLDLDPANRALLRWEAGDSVPPPRPAERRSGPRVDAAQAGSDLLETLNPAMRAIHHEDAHTPTECIAVLGQAFQSISWEAIANVPSYSSWWRGSDSRPAYAYHRRVLQVLQSGGTRGRWTLKSPHHVLALDALLATYPDARLVVLHRDPAVLVASVCSLVQTMTSTFSDADHRAYIAEHWCDLLDDSWRALEEFRARRPDVTVADVAYDALVGDPAGTVAGLYRELRISAGEGAFDAMRDHVARHPRTSLGVHRYDLAEFGLDARGVRERFSDYVSRHDVALAQPTAVR